MWRCCVPSLGCSGWWPGDPTVSRLIATLAEDADGALAAISSARATARERVWHWVGAPTQDGRVVIDLDATLLTAHSGKEDAPRTWRKTFGFHPLLGFVYHGAGGAGEPVGELLRPGKAGSNTAVDHIAVFDAAPAQLPEPLRRRDEQGRVAVSVRTDAAGATHQFAAHLARVGAEFSLGANLGHVDIHTALAQLPPQAWTPAYQARKPRAQEQCPQIELRDGAWVAELTGLVDLSAWPPSTRLILRKERPHPGAHLRITDHDGIRITGFLTTTAPGGPARQPADLELRHRCHARVEDRIRHRQGHRPCQPALPRQWCRTGSGWPSPRWP
ncbi:MAG: transposase, partial [Actinobacteria bacterium]|nr:transposase [Actinomycetota bacterium]